MVDSCKYEIKGLILDEDTREPLPYVLVNIEGTQISTLTDLKGEFKLINLCQEINTITISCLGYCDTSCKDFYHESSDKPEIFLKREVSALDAVTVVAEKQTDEGTYSLSRERIGKEDLSLDLTRSMAEALSSINGISLTSNGSNVQLPVIHGLYGNRILVLNNGMKHGFQNWGSDHAPEIDLSSVSNLMVLKGAAGVQYGPEALGGVVVAEPNELQLSSDFSSNVGTGFQTNGKGYFVSTDLGKGFKKWAYHLGANYTRIGDRHSPDYSLSNSGKQEYSINAGVRYNFEKLDLKFYYSYLNQDLGILRTSIASSAEVFVQSLTADEPVVIFPFSYDIKAPNQEVEHHLAKAELNWYYRDDAKVSLIVGSQLNKRNEYDVRRNIENPIIDLDLITNDVQLKWMHSQKGAWQGVIGIQAFTQNNDNNPFTYTTPFIPNYNTYRFSSFALESWRKNQGELEFGVRADYERSSVRGRETNQDPFLDKYSLGGLTFSLGYMYRFSAYSSLRTNVGSAWRPPNMAELFSFGQNGFKSSYGLLRHYVNDEGKLRSDKVIPIAESNVQSEKGVKWISEWEIKKKKNAFVATAYTQFIENFIFERPYGLTGTVRGPMPFYIYDQANALFVGLDLSWMKQWTASVSGVISASYLWSRNLKKQEVLINQPPLNVEYKLSWTLPLWGKMKSSVFSVRPSYTFRQYQAPVVYSPNDIVNNTIEITPDSEIFDFRDAPDGYFLMDVSWRLRYEKLAFSFAVNNVFNHSYRSYLNEMRYFADEPGINLLFNMNYIFNSK